MLLSALILSGTVIAGIGAITVASKDVNDIPKTINHINNNTVINNNNKITNNLNIKNSMNQSVKKTEDNTKALESKIESELERIQDELMEEMLQQIYINNLQNDISAKINKNK